MEYEVLNNEQVKEIYTNILKAYQRNADNMIRQSESSIPALEEKKVKNLLVSIQNVFGIFNVDFDKEKPKLLSILKNNNVIELSAFIQKLKNDAQNYNTTIDRAVKEGEKIRVDEQIKYPDFFQKHKTFFIRINDAKSAKVKQDEMFTELKKAGAEISIINRNDSTYIESDRNAEKTQPFFSRRSKLLDKVTNDMSIIDFSDDELFSAIKKSDYLTAKAIIIERGKNKETRNKALRDVISDKVLFRHIAKAMSGKNFDTKNFIPTIKELSFKYTDLADSLHYSASRNAAHQEQEVNLLQISIDPKKIATMATYTDWKSCMTADGINWDQIDGDVGRGTIIVYAMHDKNPQKKISRSLLKPYISQSNNDEIIYLQNKQYGAQIEEFKLIVDCINDELINKNDNPIGSYKIKDGIYLDDMPKNAFLGKGLGFEDMLKLKKVNYTKDNNSFVIDGNVELSGAFGLKEIKEDLIVDGIIDLQHCTKLTKLPQNIKAEYVIFLTNCKNLRKITSNIETNKNLYFNKSANLRELTGKIYAAGNIDFSECTSLQILSEGLYAGEELKISECPAIEHLPNNFHANSLKINKCQNFKKLPDNLYIKGNVEIDSAISLSTLPKNMRVDGKLDLSRCSELKEIPNDLKTGGTIKLTSCKSLEKLPNNFEVTGSLELYGCLKLSNLPNGLKVGKDCDLRNTQISKLPDDMIVKDFLILSDDSKIISLPPGVEKVKINSIALSKEKISIMKENWVKEKTISRNNSSRI